MPHFQGQAVCPRSLLFFLAGGTTYIVRAAGIEWSNAMVPANASKSSSTLPTWCCPGEGKTKGKERKEKKRMRRQRSIGTECSTTAIHPLSCPPRRLSRQPNPTQPCRTSLRNLQRLPRNFRQVYTHADVVCVAAKQEPTRALSCGVAHLDVVPRVPVLVRQVTLSTKLVDDGSPAL